MASKPWHYEGFRLSEHFWKYAQMTSFYEQIRHELVDYTEEDKAKDRYSGEHLLSWHYVRFRMRITSEYDEKEQSAVS